MSFTRDMKREIERLLRPIKVRLANSIARAVVTLVDDAPRMQLVQLGVLAGETRSDRERFQDYGLTSNPVPGAEAVVLFPNGDRGHALVVAVDDRRYRPRDLPRGVVCVYAAPTDEVPTAEVRLGGGSADDPAVRASDIEAIRQAISGAGVVANDGGAAFKSAILTAWPGTVGSSRVKIE